MLKERGVYSETKWPWILYSRTDEAVLNQSLELLVYGSIAQLPMEGKVEGSKNIFD